MPKEKLIGRLIVDFDGVDVEQAAIEGSAAGVDAKVILTRMAKERAAKLSPDLQLRSFSIAGDFNSAKAIFATAPINNKVIRRPSRYV